MRKLRISKRKISAILIFIMIPILTPDIADSYRSRLDDKGTQRAIQISDKFYKVSKDYDIPLELLIGISYNESNVRAYAVGDYGYAFSLTQIRCATDGRRFSWMPFLNKNGVKIKKCSDLLNVDTSLKATAIILRHHYSREKSWGKAVKAFHLGSNWRADRPRVRHYLKRVKYFGSQLKEQVMEHARSRIFIGKINNWLEKNLKKIYKVYHNFVTA